MTVIVVVVVLVCVLCNVSPMISHLCWSLEDLVSDPKSRYMVYNCRIKVTMDATDFFGAILDSGD